MSCLVPDRCLPNRGGDNPCAAPFVVASAARPPGPVAASNIRAT